MNNYIKTLAFVVMIINLAACCRTPEKCYPASPGNRYSMMGFIMGGGLAGHVIREVENRQQERRGGYRNNKKIAQAEAHRIYYHEVR